MSRRGFIRAEDLQDQQLEAFPYFPVDATQPHASYEEGMGSVASDLGDDFTSVPLEQRIIERLQEAERQAQEIARQAFEEGFAAGEAEGRAFGEHLPHLHPAAGDPPWGACGGLCDPEVGPGRGAGGPCPGRG